MNQENIQGLNPDESAAALSLGTRLTEDIMRHSMQSQDEGMMAAQDASQTLELPQGEEQPLEIQKDTTGGVSEEPEANPREDTKQEPKEDEVSKKVDALTKDMESFKIEIKGMIKSEIGDLTKSIQDAVK